MRHFLLATLFGLALTAILSYAASAAPPHNKALRGPAATARAAAYPWHGYYYNVTWGWPVAQLVPPTAEYQTHWGWGVGNTRVTPILHQFSRNYPGGAYAGGVFLPTPYWPSDTDQFGYYYVRGPW